MKRKTKIVIGACVAALLIYLVADYALRENIRRFYTFAGYSNAVGMYDLKGKPLPADLIEIENAYNKWDGARATLPEAPHFLHPIYRLPTGLTGGPYLLFIEPRPPGSLLPVTMLIWANADGSATRVETVANWNLGEIIQQDDDKRRTISKP